MEEDIQNYTPTVMFRGYFRFLWWISKITNMFFLQSQTFIGSCD